MFYINEQNGFRRRHLGLTVSAAVLLGPLLVLSVGAHGLAVVSAVGDHIGRARGGHCRIVLQATDRLK